MSGRRYGLLALAALAALAVAVPALDAGGAAVSRTEKLDDCLKKHKPPKKHDCIPNSGAGAVRADFDGDGFSDLAIGTPGEDVGAEADAGAVQVVYGSSRGLVASSAQLLTQDTDGILDTAQAGDRFGSALAGGDFNADGFADLAIGVPGEDRELANRVITRDSGAVNVVYGTADGLNPAASQVWTQDMPDIVDSGESGDEYGSALAWGELGAGSAADLVIGAPGEDRGIFDDAGAAYVIFGGSNGLTATFNTDAAQPPGGDHIFRQGLRAGAALTTGSFGGDERDDIAIGEPGLDLGAATDAGGVQIIFSRFGTDFDEGPRFNSATPVAGAQLGTSLAAGDFVDVPTAPGADEIAAGAPFQDVGGVRGAGAVQLLFGGPANGNVSFGPLLTESAGSGTPELDDHFGLSLAVGNFDGAGIGDLAVGVPGQQVGTAGHAGAVLVLYRFTAAGIPTGRQGLVQTGGETPETRDGFGTSLSAWNFNGDGFTDLAVGAPFEDLGQVADAGAVSVFSGAAGGLSTSGVGLITQATLPGDAPEPGDVFGFVMY